MSFLGQEKFWCQMCQKQCKDKRGFEDHCNGQAHAAAMSLFAKEPEKYLEEFSSRFEEQFMEVLKERYGDSRTKITLVYAIYCANPDPERVRLNGTRWATVGEFAQYLEKTGGRASNVTVHTEAGDGGQVQHYVQLMDVVPREVLQKRADDVRRVELRKKREAAEQDRDFEHRRRLLLQKQAERQADELVRSVMSSDQKPNAVPVASDQVSISLSVKKTQLLEGSAFDRMEKDAGGPAKRKNPEPKLTGVSATLESLKGELDRKKRRKDDSDWRKKQPEPPVKKEAAEPEDRPWLLPGITVKVLAERLGGGVYYKTKGFVEKIEDGGFVGKVRLHDAAAATIDQQQLETVVPKPGGAVVVVAGPHRGARGVLAEVLPNEFSARIALKNEVLTLRYEHFSKAVKT
ncbi:KIN17-like protein [Diplonema papillatum]|nr:KIN17-like protein [Diplonema papillatum]WGM50019.1 KIN17 [Diplonema papillatum]